ncbi:hypothetical protein c7_L676 [Megavirus courdo7]|uniref:Uncharacterized protein n=1 Tax=Megavirus courdo7 TaxID=1128135 RepID=H2EBG6_9VIRU|nr:hypothetical protein c7_L676 [Megavirus courdo7]
MANFNNLSKLHFIFFTYFLGCKNFIHKYLPVNLYLKLITYNKF